MIEFEISNNLNIYLYGDNKQSETLLLLLSSQGFTIRGILDAKYKKVQTIASSSCPMEYSCSDTLAMSSDKDNILVIVCLNNGFVHPLVAKQLFGIGIKKVIYLPMDANEIPINVQNRMTSLYNNIIDFGFSFSFKYPFSYLYFEDSVGYTKYRIIDINTQYSSFLCPIKLLFSQTFSDIQSKLSNQVDASAISMYSDKQIECYKLYLSLFDFLNGNKEADVDSYLRLFRKDEEKRAELLDDRIRMYEMFNYNLKYNFSFFLNSPATCSYSGEKIRVIDGFHRIFFLISKGYTVVPIKLEKNDFESFLKAKANNEVI